jgi:light-regulated signal transduction histidine kinase (bacteriophytochrome)
MEELSRSNEELERFAYVASHDLQEPLRMVSSYMNLLARRYKGKLGDDADEYFHFATDGAARMRQLIVDLLNYSRIQQGKETQTRISCGKTVETVLHGLRLSIEETGARVEVSTLPEVVGNPSQLQQLFQNLVGNALKFRSDSPPYIRIAVDRQDGYWLFSVRDNGIGMDMDNANRIFEVFQRLHTRGEYPGTGIGLAICKRIVEAHGGKIWVESSPGEGSCFFFTLPVVSRQLRPVSAPLAGGS